MTEQGIRPTGEADIITAFYGQTRPIPTAGALQMKVLVAHPRSVRPELVEGLYMKIKGFDRLSPNGMQW